MKRGRPAPKPPIVETRRRTHGNAGRTDGATAGNTRPRHDRGLARGRAAQAKAADEDRATQRQVEIFVARLRGANDPSVLTQAAEAVVYRDEAQKVAASIIPLHHPHFGDCLLITSREKEANKGFLAHVFQKLLPAVTFVKHKPQDARVPSSLKPFVKAMRSGGD
jgi:hypothetical protein